MADVAARLDRFLRAAGFAITGVSIGREADKATWKVFPATLQPSAQASIDGFDPNDPVIVNAELTATVTAALDDMRLTAATVWVLMRTIFPSDTVAQTRTKFNAQPNGARQQIIDAYQAQPWK